MKENQKLEEEKRIKTMNEEAKRAIEMRIKELKTIIQRF